MSTFVGSIVGRPFGFNSGNNSFVVAMSFMSRYLAPTILGPCSKLVVTHVSDNGEDAVEKRRCTCTYSERELRSLL